MALDALLPRSSRLSASQPATCLLSMCDRVGRDFANVLMTFPGNRTLHPQAAFYRARWIVHWKFFNILVNKRLIMNGDTVPTPSVVIAANEEFSVQILNQALETPDFKVGLGLPNVMFVQWTDSHFDIGFSQVAYNGPEKDYRGLKKLYSHFQQQRLRACELSELFQSLQSSCQSLNLRNSAIRLSEDSVKDIENTREALSITPRFSTWHGTAFRFTKTRGLVQSMQPCAKCRLIYDHSSRISDETKIGRTAHPLGFCAEDQTALFPRSSSEAPEPFHLRS